MKNNGVSFVEMLLVVIVLGIVASITIPQYSAAGEDAKISHLRYNLQNIRWQIQLYKNQHNGMLPTANGLSFIDAMTKCTYAGGSIAKEQKTRPGVFGPYLNRVPKNPFITDESAASIIKCGPQTPEADGSSGWFFNTTTGAFNANDNTTHSAL